MTDPRSYHSPKRDQAKSKTREAIFEATVRVILDEGVHAFTMQNVAKSAGISLRTVYRHFETREAILEGIQDSGQARAKDYGLELPSSAEGLIEFATPLFTAYYQASDLIKAQTIAAVALGHHSRGQEETFKALRKILRDSFPHLSGREITAAAGVVRVSLGRYSWYVLSVDLKFSLEQAIRATQLSVSSLLQDLAKRDRTLRKSSTKKAKPVRTKEKS